MIESGNLMIGNFVLIDGKVERVWGITYVEPDVAYQVHYGKDGFTYAVEGIPLTEEGLIKFGFEKDEALLKYYFPNSKLLCGHNFELWHYSFSGDEKLDGYYFNAGHVVFDDFNIDGDGLISWCIEEASKDNNEENEEMKQASIEALKYFLTLTEEERMSALAIRDGRLLTK